MRVDSEVLGIQIYRNVKNVYSFVYEHSDTETPANVITKLRAFISQNNIDLINDATLVVKSCHKARAIVDLYNDDPEEDEFLVWRPIYADALADLLA